MLDCKTSVTGHEYSGGLSVTKSGLKCQSWSDQTPHPHTMTDPNRFPDADLDASQNFCRNPDKREGGPWCYTVDDFLEWDYCDIQLCQGQMENVNLIYFIYLFSIHFAILIQI